MAVKKLPRPVTFAYPNGNTIKGWVRAEVAEDEKSDRAGKDYRNVIQRLEMENGETWVRFGYYKKDLGQGEKGWQWSSQTTATLSPECAKRLIRQAEENGIL